ncbi:hypothetical protein F2Q70_00017646 [Brassica cretica]|uniref:Uncharacterized protein n=1 Tax=Brassica cretica TaxID=69181 RepID=A0A8S9HPU2_BRACR|nr:hypothetical protein F2Q70_00017646 [Brassica cretica]KAF2600683.1 hypothetical protein F2Q68_00010582 [Brassica cretica]
MSKRSASSVPTAADRARLKIRMDSPVSRSDSSSEPCEGSDCDLMAPLPLSCVYAAPHWWILPRRSVRTIWRNGGVGIRFLLPLSSESLLRKNVLPATSQGRSLSTKLSLTPASGGDSCSDCWFMQPFRDLAFSAEPSSLENPHSYPKSGRLGVFISCRDSPCSRRRRVSCYPGTTASCRSSPGELLG